MAINVVENKSTRLFVFLGAFFTANALIAEFIGVKIFSVEKLFGLVAADLTVFGVSGLSFNLTAGALLWPFVFVMTDIINEYYGTRGVRMLSFIAAGLISYSFLMFYMGIALPPADFWIGVGEDQGVANMDNAFGVIFGQGLWIIIGSLIAFLIGQLVDVTVFHQLKRFTGERQLWLRATGSTFVSQFIDSFVVLFIAFYIGAGWDITLVLAIGVVNYIYKFLMAIVLTPLIYILHFVIDRYLGEPLAGELKAQAMAVS